MRTKSAPKVQADESAPDQLDQMLAEVGDALTKANAIPIRKAKRQRPSSDPLREQLEADINESIARSGIFDEKPKRRRAASDPDDRPQRKPQHEDAPGQRALFDDATNKLNAALDRSEAAAESEPPGAITTTWKQPALTAEEQEVFRLCEGIILTGVSAWRDTGEALRRIRDERLYRDTHLTFAAYLDERWHFSEAHVTRCIQASEVLKIIETLPIGKIRPETPEYLIRPFARLCYTDPADGRRRIIDAKLVKRAWQQTVDLCCKTPDGTPVLQEQWVKKAVAGVLHRHESAMRRTADKDDPTARAAKLCGVTPDEIEAAAEIIAAAPDVAERVTAGEITLDQAALIVASKPEAVPEATVEIEVDENVERAPEPSLADALEQFIDNWIAKHDTGLAVVCSVLGHLTEAYKDRLDEQTETQP